MEELCIFTLEMKWLVLRIVSLLETTLSINNCSSGHFLLLCPYYLKMQDPTLGMGNGVVNGTNVNSTVLSPNFTLFTGTPTYVANMRVRSNAPANLAENETKIEVLKRQQICLSQVPKHV